MKLADIKKRMATVQPFLTIKLMGIGGAMAAEIDGAIVPLSVVVSPPSLSFIAESGFITSLITRYSKTYTESLLKQELPKDEKQGAIQKMLEEVKEGLMSSEEEQAKQLSLIVKLGKTFLMAKAIYGYYLDPKDTFKVTFLDDKTAVDEGNRDLGDEELYILIDLLEDMELVKIGSELVSALPTTDVANIPFESETAEGKTEVTDSAPADKVGKFRRSLRSVTVEDVPPPSGEGNGDTRQDASV